MRQLFPARMLRERGLARSSRGLPRSPRKPLLSPPQRAPSPQSPRRPQRPQLLLQPLQRVRCRRSPWRWPRGRPVAAAASSEVFTLAMPMPYTTVGSGAMRQLYGLARPSRTGTSPASPRRGDEVLSLSSSAEMRRGSDLLRRRDPRTTRSALRPRHNLPRVWGMVESSDAHEVDDAHGLE